MKRIILSSAVLLALLTGCTEEKKAPVQEQVTQEVKKDEVMPVQVTEEMKKDEVVEEKVTEEVKDETVKEESK
ncbi:MAG: hypothetical protein U5K55_07170 [Aliarcobacter sp.]|nr:hypothetical protein [Aliarcobacter sp.]